ncbi:putative maltose transporter [Streptomyces sp. NBRC 110611]|nr:sugar ABC transporter permease [Streptomyces sp. NBRC 110611]GAU69454.1 putative maltose transporter [Streptomyces sp. NBRC 110611]
MTFAVRVRRALGTHWYAWTMVAPVVLVIGVIIGYPLVRGVFLSLTDANEANVERHIGVNHIPATYTFTGLDNYQAVLTDGVFWDRLGWTVVWTVSCVGLTFLIALTLANMLNRKLRGRTFYRLALILPWAIPAFVSVFTWRMLYNEKHGILNKLLAGGGLDGIPWLNDPTWAKLSVIAVNVWLGVPFMIVALLGGLTSIPGELYEAAEMDGASAWQRFRHITLPGLRAVSSTVILLSTIWTFNMFPVIFLLTRGGPGDATEILVTYAYRLSFVDSPRDFSGSATWGVLILALLSVGAVAYRRALRKQGEVW